MQAYLGSESEDESELDEASKERFRKLLNNAADASNGRAKDWVNGTTELSEVGLPI